MICNRASFRRLVAGWAVLSLLGLCGCATRPGDSPNAGPGGFGSLFRGKGSPWTILCIEVQGPHRTAQVNQIAETLERTPGIRRDAVFVRDDRDGYARLYYGTYFRRTDSKTGKRSMPKRLAADLKMIKELGAGEGRRLFVGSMMVPMPSPDVGNPEWALTNVDAVYSLQVALFEPAESFWDFKKAAVEYCAALRERGFEAYYHHSRGSSTVTVGSFGKDAVIARGRGLPYYSRQVGNLQQSDELMKYNRLNGHVYRARGASGKLVTVPSRLVRIPSPEKGDGW